jgi:large subunit ribosomal protein L35
LPSKGASAITPAFRRPAKGCRGGGFVLHNSTHVRDRPADRVSRIASAQESQMPKMKTKSGVKKRFRLTGTGKVISTQANKRHGMIKRTNKQIRQQRGTTMMSPSDAKIVKKWMPYG